MGFSTLALKPYGTGFQQAMFKSNGSGFVDLYGALSGSGVPADALGNLGDRYYDTAAGRWYLKRWVGNFNNDRCVLNDILFGGNADWDLSFLVNGLNVGVDQRFVGQQLTGGAGTTLITASGSIAFCAIWGFVNPAIIINAMDSTWHKLRFRRTGNFFESWKDGVPGSSGTNTNATVAATLLVFGDGAGGPGSTSKMANFSITGYGKSLRWNFDEGSGLVATDSSGGGRNGKITDNAPTNFWLQAWVPMDLL